MKLICKFEIKNKVNCNKNFLIQLAKKSIQATKALLLKETPNIKCTKYSCTIDVSNKAGATASQFYQTLLMQKLGEDSFSKELLTSN